MELFYKASEKESSLISFEIHLYGASLYVLISLNTRILINMRMTRMDDLKSDSTKVQLVV